MHIFTGVTLKLFSMSSGLGAKLKIIQTLISQLLSFGTLRDEIEERLEKLRIAKQDLKQLQWARQRREKEEAALRYL